jgi:hypothetical protein
VSRPLFVNELAVLFNPLAEVVKWHRKKLLFVFRLPRDAGGLYPELTDFTSIGGITDDMVVGDRLKKLVFRCWRIARQYAIV